MEAGALDLNRPLTDETFRQGLHELTEHDPALAGILHRYGPPPLWERPTGFATLVHIILEQQVSLASALAAFRRLQAAIEPITPANFLTLDDATLKTIGFSRQKTAYARYLAQVVHSGQLDLTALETSDDATVRAALTAIKGIGNWTVDVYLLMALRRPDAWPKGDLALQIAVQQVLQLEKRPFADELEALSQPWQPWRAIAARLFWHHYLSQRARKG